MSNTPIICTSKQQAFAKIKELAGPNWWANTWIDHERAAMCVELHCFDLPCGPENDIQVVWPSNGNFLDPVKKRVSAEEYLALEERSDIVGPCDNLDERILGLAKQDFEAGLSFVYQCDLASLTSYYRARNEETTARRIGFNIYGKADWATVEALQAEIHALIGQKYVI